MNKDFEIRATGMQSFVNQVADKQAAGCRLVRGSGKKIGMKLLLARMVDTGETFEPPLVGETRKIQLPQFSQNFTTNVDNLVDAQENGEFIVGGSYYPQAVYTGSVLVSTKAAEQKEETPPPEKEPQEDTTPKPKAKAKAGGKGKPKKQAQKKESE